MEGFSFEVVGDAGKADKAIDGVLERLDRIAPRARQAGDALTNAYNRAATIVEQYNRAVENGSGGKFAESQRDAAAGIRGTIEQLQREKDALDAIRGPVQQYQNELQALTQLLSKGAINAQEFNTRLQQIRPPTAFKASAGGGGGGFDLGSLAGSLPGGSIIAGAAGGGVAGAAMAGVQTAIGGAHQIIEMADAYTSLNNRLKALTGSEQGATDAFNKIAASAKHTRSDLNTTADAFITISLATKEMGISQQRVMAFTEHLNEDIAMSGASAQAAAGGMLQLSQALSVGKLQGQDLKALIANTPIVAQRIAEGMGISFGKLRELAEEGKVTAADIIAAYEKTGPEIERAFGKSVPTIAQQFTLLKNQVSLSVGELAKDANVTKAFADTCAVLSAAVKATADQINLWNSALGEVGLSLGDLTAGSGSGLVGAVKFFGDLDYSIDGLQHALTGTAVPAKHYADQQEVINRVVAMGTGHMNEYAAAQAETAIRLTLGEKAASEFAAKMSNVSAETERAQRVAKAFQDTFGEMTVGINEASHALGKLGEALNDNAQDRAYSIVGARAAEVRNATIQLDALKLAFESGRYPAALYREEAQKLRDVINGVSSSSKTAAKELDALGKKLLRGESASDRTIRLNAADRAQQTGERSYLTELDQKATFDSSARYRAELEQLNDVESRTAHTADEHAQRVIAIRDAYLKTLGVYDSVYGKLAAEDQQLVKLNEALRVGAINAYEFARAVDEYERAAARKNAVDAAKKFQGEASGYAAMKKFADEAAKENIKAAEKTKEAWASASGQIAADLVSAFQSSDQSIDQMLEHTAEQIAMVLLRMSAAQVGGPGGAFLSAFVGGLPGHANGTQFMVGGQGGTDQNIVAFRASNDERVTVETSADRQSGKYFGRGGGTTTISPTFKVLMPPERRDIVDDSRSGLTTLVKLERKRRRSGR